MEAKATPQAPQVFKGAAVPYTAFSLRDPYYFEMANLVVTEAKQVAESLGDPNTPYVIDLGAGVGVSTMVARKRFGENILELFAVEPEEDMRSVLAMNLMGDPTVTIVPAKAQNLVEKFGELGLTSSLIDLVMCCQMFHLLKDDLGQALQQIHKLLDDNRLLVFDLGPSNWEFTTHKLADHRSGKKPTPDEVMTELAHPLYQQAHQMAYKEVLKRYPDFDRENLWPPAAKRYTRADLEAALNRNGFDLVRVSEILVPISGERIINFIRNGWSVFCRWAPLDKLSMEEKLSLMEQVIGELMDDKDSMSLTAYHPTAILTAVKR